MATLQDELQRVLADTSVLRIKTQNYHWNVKGPMFVSLHQLFEEHYNDFTTFIDVVAERIRAVGGTPYGSMKKFLALTTLTENEKPIDADAMVADLAEDQRKLEKTVEAALKAAQDEGDEATADMLIARLRQHGLNAWMLDSIQGK